MTEVIGIDLGGTNIVAARANAEGAVLQEHRVPTEAAKGAETVYQNILTATRHLMTDAVTAVGIGSPGLIDPVRGMSVSPVFNLPGWEAFPVRDRLAADLGVPVHVDNDANLAALGEAWQGAGRGARVVLLFTLGTGIGGGIVMDGRVYRGFANRVAEFGLVCVDANGKRLAGAARGPVELYASADSVARTARALAAETPDGSLAKASGGDESRLTAKLICDLARDGDPQAGAVLDGAAAYLASAIGTVLAVLDPERVLLAGGMALAGDVFVGRVQKALMDDRAFTPYLRDDLLRVAELGDRAGLIGAIRLALCHSSPEENRESSRI